MRNNYTIENNRLIGSLSFIDLENLSKDFICREVTVYDNDKSLSFSALKTVFRGYWCYAFEVGDFTTLKFTDVVKIFKENGFKTGSDVKITVSGVDEFVELYDGSIAENNDDVCFTYDDEDYRFKSECYYCETDSEWYASDDDLVDVEGDYYRSDDDYISYCENCNEYHFSDDFCEVHTGYRSSEYWCQACRDNDAFCCDDCGEWWSTGCMNTIDRPEKYVCDRCYADYFYCEGCGQTVHYDYWNSDAEMCDECAGEQGGVMSYHWHHSNFYENKNTLFMPKGKMIRLGSAEVKDTCGLELEVSKSNKDGQEDTIDALNALQAAENEFYYEQDGSLDDGGFEIITGVHTFQSLKEMKWEKILEVLRENGYSSHDGGLCGLHIHVGRQYFGRDDNEQSNAIGKIYAFYSLFWDDLVKASRRENFTYCHHPFEEYDGCSINSRLKSNKMAVRKKIFEKAKNKDGSHGLALNNSNHGTFEFRLGRGTLNYASFMAWIDFTLTIAKNSRKIAIKSLADIDKWLSGISSDTAFYLQKRHAFIGSKVVEELTRKEDAICA
mgnify:CR=1 FL=1